MDLFIVIIAQINEDIDNLNNDKSSWYGKEGEHQSTIDKLRDYLPPLRPLSTKLLELKERLPHLIEYLKNIDKTNLSEDLKTQADDLLKNLESRFIDIEKNYEKIVCDFLKNIDFLIWFIYNLANYKITYSNFY